ncbi:MAG TPA: L-2-hydroxyglutarate oxidase [Solirubrobacteraceae bacterium]|nr:L-2-hydroxyglutarate oxidase [Solirubrobacteraceae bacterium]
MHASATAPERCDLAVIGGGIIGVAVARELARSYPARKVCLLEREQRLAAHQSSHNSGVVHAGLYYAPGSLKARLCREGADALYAYCEEKGVPHRRCGKLVAAVSERELPALAEIERRAAANGVPGLRRLQGAQIARYEPHLRAIAALHSPQSGIADFAAVTASLAADLRALGGAIATSCAVVGLRERPRGLLIAHERGELLARYAICCAGAWADRVAALAGGDPDPRIVPFRGSYLALEPRAAERVRALIYPVPDPRLPFLGVHLTRHIDGRVLLGPSALPAASRGRCRGEQQVASDLWQSLTWPGSWRMARRFWRVGAGEVALAVSTRAFARAASRYLPELSAGDLRPAFAGLRAQAVSRSGALLDDFAISFSPRALHVRNAPSPGATAALAIARHIVGLAARALEW